MMYIFECLTSARFHSKECSPFSGACYPDVEGNCGPECSPVDECSPDYDDDQCNDD